MKDRHRRIGKVALFLLLGVATTLFMSTMANFLITLSERETHKAPGVLVDVGGKKIHVYSQGTGPKNVVLLSGLGTLSPEVDFRDLADELKSAFRVTIVEYPGYGWSSDTDELRSTSNSVEEIRAALSRARILPPYILVPHSFSGLQSLYYANKYPSEISGIVGLDISVPEQVRYSARRQESFNVFEILRVLGIVRLLLLIDPTISTGQIAGVSSAELADYNRFVNWNAGSHATFGESNEFASNLRSLLGLKFPATIPATLVLSSQGASRKGPGVNGETWVRIHQDVLEGKTTSKLVVLEGSHYIHHQNAEKIAVLVEEIAGGRP